MRTQERGAALVEACVVVPTLMLLLMSSLFLHHVIAKQHRCMLVARDRAWSGAMNGCTTGKDVPQPDLTSRMDGAPGSDVSLVARLGSTTGNAYDFTAVSIIGGNVNGTSYFQTTGARAVVFCNANTENGDVKGVLRYVMTGDLWRAIFQ